MKVYLTIFLLSIAMVCSCITNIYQNKRIHQLEQGINCILNHLEIRGK